MDCGPQFHRICTRNRPKLLDMTLEMTPESGFLNLDDFCDSIVFYKPFMGQMSPRSAFFAQKHAPIDLEPLRWEHLRPNWYGEEERCSLAVDGTAIEGWLERHTCPRSPVLCLSP